MLFTKMHGAGNDFIILDNRDGQFSSEELSALAVKLCDVHTGVGANGMMIVTDSEKADFAMLFYNNDGSLGEMCGNGARCICRYGHDNGLAGDIQRVETTAGIVVGKRIDERRYQVRLNDPSVMELHRAVEIDGAVYDCAYAELGDPGIPHAVVRLDGWDEMDIDVLRKLGRKLRRAEAFPKGANVTFVKKLNENELKAVTYERGVEDFTLACGTGCGSSVAALTLLGLVSGKDVRIHMPGGTLEITLDAENGKVRNILLTGPTDVICRGELFEIE